MADSQHTPAQRARVVLSIGGSDSSAGAGIQADIKAGAAFGVYVATAITAVTAQNSASVSGIYALTAQQLRAQIDAVMSSLPVDAIKLGMLANGELLQVVAEFIREACLPVVLDPVLGATSGSALTNGADIDTLYREHLMPHASLITPNLLEAARLLGCPPAKDYADMEQQAQALQQLGARAVLLKGGHLNTPLACDCLFIDRPQPFSAPRVDTPHTHGSGCTLATAIAAGLAQGLTLAQAVAAAKTYVQGAIQAGPRLNLVQDNGPLQHFYQYW